MQTRNGNFIIADLVESTRHARHLGTTTGSKGPRKQLGCYNKGPTRTEVTEAGGPSRLSKVVVMSVVLGVEQAWAEDQEGVPGESPGHQLRWIQAMAASISNQRRVCCAAGKSAGIC
jgi:hypothetical protein